MADAFIDDVDHPTDFKDQRLQKLDFDLRCSICQEFYATPMQLTTCVHCFCAVCIRRRLAVERTCPTCAKPADESKLTRNSALEHAVNSWKATRKFIIDLEQNTQIHSKAPPTVVPNLPAIPATASLPVSAAPAVPPDVNIAQQPSNPSSSSRPPAVTPASASRSTQASAPVSAPTQGTRRSPRIERKRSAEAAANGALETVNDLTATPPVSQPVSAAVAPATPSQAPTATRDPPLQPGPNDIVECFNCFKSVKMSHINSHLDKCLQEPQPSPSPSSSSRSSHPLQQSTLSKKSPQYDEKYLGKKPIKLVYGMMNIKDLRKVLRDLGISDNGNDKNLLIWRHREWLTLYQANMDAEHPVDFHTLKRRLAEAEETYVNSRGNGYKQSPDLEQHKARYEDHFQQLLADVRKRKVQTEHSKQPPPSVRSSQQDDAHISSTQSMPSPSPLPPPPPPQ